MIAYINDEYEDGLGQPLEIDPKIVALCKTYQLTDQSSVSFKDVPGGTDRFEAWAATHYVTGNHAVQMVDHKCYLDLYVMEQTLPPDVTMTVDQPQSTPAASVAIKTEVSAVNSNASSNDQLTVQDFIDPLAGDESALASQTVDPESLVTQQVSEATVTTDSPTSESTVNLESVANSTQAKDTLSQAPAVESVASDDVKTTDDQTELFNSDRFFNDLPDSQQVGSLTVNRILKDSPSHSAQVDSISLALMRSTLKTLLRNSLVTQLVERIGYAELTLSYVMYMATVTKQINVKHWREWCVGQVVMRISKTPAIKKKFVTHATIRDVITDNQPVTKLSEPVRWFMLLSTLRPSAELLTSETKVERKLDQLQNELWLLNALQTSVLASEDIDPQNWPELLSGQRAKKLRVKVNQLRLDLIKPYETMKRSRSI